MAEKEYKIIAGRYGFKVKEGTPVVFANGIALDLGMLKDGSIVYLNNKSTHEEVLKRPYNPLGCFPVGESYVEGMWGYFSMLWKLVSGSRSEQEKLYKGVPLEEKDIAVWDAKVRENRDFLRKVDEEQKELGELLYRYLDFPYADGKAIYQVTEVCGTMVRITHCQGLGDDWKILEYGDEAVILQEQAAQIVSRRERLNDMMKRK